MTDHGGAASPRTALHEGIEERLTTSPDPFTRHERIHAFIDEWFAAHPEGWWVPATAKGTAIGTDEWGRRLYVHVTDEPHPLSGAVAAQEAPAPDGLRERLLAAFRHEECAGSHRPGYCTGVLVSHDRIESIVKELIR